MTYNSSDSPIIPILRVLYYSPVFFSDSSIVLHDSPIFPIIRFVRLLFSDFCDSPRSTRFSDFSDYTILPIVILRFYDSPRSTRFSDFSDCPPILPIFRFHDSSNYSTLLGISGLEPLKLLFYNMITTLHFEYSAPLYSRFKDYFIFPFALNLRGKIELEPFKLILQHDNLQYTLNTVPLVLTL